LATRRHAQPSAVGTPTQSQPPAQVSCVVVVLQSQVVVVVLDVVLVAQSGK